jgi:hypothetical protein
MPHLMRWYDYWEIDLGILVLLGLALLLVGLLRR